MRGCCEADAKIVTDAAAATTATLRPDRVARNLRLVAMPIGADGREDVDDHGAVCPSDCLVRHARRDDISVALTEITRLFTNRKADRPAEHHADLLVVMLVLRG